MPTGGTGARHVPLQRRRRQRPLHRLSAAQGDNVDRSGVTVSLLANNLAWLDGSMLIAQAGYV
jgi:hypothetical protein